MLNDDSFVEKLKTGNREAFNELIACYGNHVINTCYRFLLDKQDAEDISQEVFIEVALSVKHFRGDSKLSTWIYRITVTKCLDELKKRKRKKRITSFGKTLHLDEIANWISGGNMPDKQLLENETMKEIHVALDSLPDNQRVAFTLSKLEGYTNSEISEILNTTTVAVESLIYRAKKNVSNVLKRVLKK